ncbi:hypothetical protein AQUCO_00400730v1 [Aquilegia coerulea]|uniref:F-box domain-containing protein n=1 Tax=Aquilegia coerulea TaxID=218851 RepID=A0A2G5EWB5_AQUCA|nr:hypothetical protein AQUCO_00400730v1 [Aquilegia coerulea]
MEILPGLPEEIGLECLTRLSFTTHRVASMVCHRWRNLLESKEFYSLRKKEGKTHQVACLVYSLPNGIRKQTSSPVYGIAVFDPVNQNWEKLDPIPKYPNGLPLFCQLSSVEGKLVVMGGWDPITWDPVNHVFVYDFMTQRWKQCKDMPSKRSFFAASAIDDRVYIAGGHDESKNALKSAWIYDVRKDEWTELTQMSEERDECEGLIVGKEFWVVSGYGTEHQGIFEQSVESYELSTNQWKRIEGKWGSNRCPRGCVSVGKNGSLMSWADLDAKVRVGTCAVELGELTLVTGLAYQGATQGFFLVDMKKGDKKLERVDVPEEFSGFVQSGCCVEI